MWENLNFWQRLTFNNYQMLYRLLFLAQKWSKGDDWYRWTLRRLWIFLILHFYSFKLQIWKSLNLLARKKIIGFNFTSVSKDLFCMNTNFLAYLGRNAFLIFKVFFLFIIYFQWLLQNMLPTHQVFLSLQFFAFRVHSFLLFRVCSCFCFLVTPQFWNIFLRC